MEEYGFMIGKVSKVEIKGMSFLWLEIFKEINIYCYLECFWNVLEVLCILVLFYWWENVY